MKGLGPEFTFGIYMEKSMNSFRNHRLRDLAVPMSTAWLLNDIAEAKGRQEIYTRQSPQVLKAPRDGARVRSTTSMSAHAYTEDRRVEQPAIGLFAELGWRAVSAWEETFGASGTLRRETKGAVKFSSLTDT